MKVRNALFVLVALAVACKKTPRAGDACEPLQSGMVGCANATTALFCQDMTLRAVSCGGPKGCSVGACDARRARAGDACELSGFGAPPPNACSDEGVLECVGGTGLGKWTLARPCRGPQKCTMDPSLKCDDSVGEVGDVCENAPACSVDGKRVLRCEYVISLVKSKFVEQADCAGSKGCVLHRSDALTVARCDYSNATLGSVCGKGNESLWVCAPDGASILWCDPDTMKFTTRETCAKGERCTTKGGHATCEKS